MILTIYKLLAGKVCAFDISQKMIQSFENVIFELYVTLLAELTFSLFYESQRKWVKVN